MCLVVWLVWLAIREDRYDVRSPSVTPVMPVKERLEVTYYGATVWTELRERIIKAAGCQPVCTISGGQQTPQRQILEFEPLAYDLHPAMARIRQSCTEVNVRIIPRAYQQQQPPPQQQNYGPGGYGGYGAASYTYAPKPKKFLKVYIVGGDFYWVSIIGMNEDDPLKEVLWVRDNGIHITGTSRKVEPDQLVKIIIYTQAEREAEEAAEEKAAKEKTHACLDALEKATDAPISVPAQAAPDETVPFLVTRVVADTPDPHPPRVSEPFPLPKPPLPPVRQQPVVITPGCIRLPDDEPEDVSAWAD